MTLGHWRGVLSKARGAVCRLPSALACSLSVLLDTVQMVVPMIVVCCVCHGAVRNPINLPFMTWPHWLLSWPVSFSSPLISSLVFRRLFSLSIPLLANDTVEVILQQLSLP